jgi:DNA-binding Xre family transcriptional regulator
MKKATNWQRYFRSQMADPTMRKLVDEELKTLRVGAQLARLRQEAGLSQTQLAAKVGMSAPNISRIESSSSQNLTLQTLVKLFGALDHEIAIVPKPRRAARRQKRPA